MNVSKMNVNPGGKQWVMREGFWDGKPQKMNFALGMLKGWHNIVLIERGLDTRNINVEKMRKVLVIWTSNLKNQRWNNF